MTPHRKPARDHLDLVLAQWAAEAPDLDAAPMGVVGRVQRATRLLDKAIADRFAAHDLQLWEFDLLATLLRSGAPYELTAGRLSELSMVSSGAVTNRVDRLERRGLVERRTDPDNRRRVLITLTGAGAEKVRAALADHVENEARLLAALGTRERTQLADLLRTLLVGLGDVARED